MINKPKILIADDDNDIRDLLKDILENDYHIIEAINGEDALNHIMDENLALVLLDIMMPKLDGYEVAQQIISNNIDVPFIFLSAKGETHFMDELEIKRSSLVNQDSSDYIVGIRKNDLKEVFTTLIEWK